MVRCCNNKWQMEWLQGNFVFISALVLNCCTEPHPICGADGTCLCSCLGMDYWPLYIGASFMVLMRFWSSLPTMLKLSVVTSWPDMLEWSYIGEGAFWCSLNLSANVLADSPMYSSSHSTLSHLYLYMPPLFSGYDLYPLEPWWGFWWQVPLWNAPVPHTSCMIFWCSHCATGNMEPPCINSSVLLLFCLLLLLLLLLL